MSEIKTLEMPKWGLSMEEGLLARWAIQEGDDFTRGQEICEIETSKIVNVLEAPFAGTLRRMLAREGETLQVGAVLAWRLTRRSAMLNWTNLLPAWRRRNPQPQAGGCRAGRSGTGRR